MAIENPDPLLSLQNVGAYYLSSRAIFNNEKFWALKDVSFNLFEGESLGIIGRNGAGKSTLLRLIAGIVEPDKGVIINKGAKATLLSLRLSFIPYLNGRENAILNGLLLGLHKYQIEEKIDSIAAFSELGHFFEQPVNTYSSGMRVRLSFSIAIHLDANLLLIDEVLGVGDESFRKKSSEAIHELIRSNRTVVLVSHNIAALKKLCDRLVWIEDGVKKMEGDAVEVADAYSLYIEKNK